MPTIILIRCFLKINEETLKIIVEFVFLLEEIYVNQAIFSWIRLYSRLLLYIETVSEQFFLRYILASRSDFPVVKILREIFLSWEITRACFHPKSWPLAQFISRSETKSPQIHKIKFSLLILSPPTVSN